MEKLLHTNNGSQKIILNEGKIINTDNNKSKYN